MNVRPKVKEWQIGKNCCLELGEHAVLMGILNITPDSFSDGGQFYGKNQALHHADILIKEGAQIIDVGGESTRPGATPILAKEEQRRVLDTISELVKRGGAYVSVDTYHPETARAALVCGAHIINDVEGLQKESAMADIIAQMGAGIIIMHNARGRAVLDDVIEDQKYFFDRSLTIAQKAGIKREQIALDPGFGFGKDAAQNFELLARIEALQIFDYPFIAATSRKRFIGTATNQNYAPDRDVATAATSAFLRERGFCVFRVHNVKINKDALAIIDALIAERRNRTDTCENLLA